MKANGHAAHDSQPKPIPAIYASFVAALDLRRSRLGLSLVDVDERWGRSEGLSSKIFYPAAASHGRGMTWQAIAELCDVLFPNGVTVRLIPTAGPTRPGSLAHEPKGARSLLRHYLQRIGAAGGRASWRNLSPEERSARARRAGKASAQRRREKLAADKRTITAALAQTKPRLGVGSVVQTAAIGRRL